LQYLVDKGVKFEVIHYLDTPPSEAELTALLSKLALPARKLLRTNESEFIEHNLSNAQFSDADLIRFMCRFPKLIERPIVFDETRAVIARPLAVLQDFC